MLVRWRLELLSAGIRSPAHSSLKETTLSVDFNLLLRMFDQRLDDLHIVIGSDDTENLNGCTNHHDVRELNRFERHRTSRVDETW